MGRKVFITMLGDTFYNKTTYRSYNTGEPILNTRFVQLATLKLIHAEEWSTEESLFVIGLTKEAKDTNWKNKGERERRLGDRTVKEEYIGLQEELGLNYPNLKNTKICDISDNKDQSDFFALFYDLYESIQDGDELYFDMTFGYRYLPMLVLVFSNYARLLKKNIKKIEMYYGYFNPTTKESTIFNLEHLISLQDWTYAAGKYIESGKVEDFKKLTQIKKDTDENSVDEESNTPTTAFVDQLTHFVDCLITCRGFSLWKEDTIKNLKEEIAKLSDNSNPVFKPIIDKIKKDIEEFIPEQTLENCYYAAKWCAQKGLYQQAATFLEEYIYARHMLNNGMDTNELMKKTSEYVNEVKYQWIRLSKDYGSAMDNKPVDKGNIDEIYTTVTTSSNPLFNDPKLTDKEYCQQLDQLIKHRNDFNHCGFKWDKPEPKAPESLKTDIDKYLLWFDPKSESAIESTNLMEALSFTRDYAVSLHKLSKTLFVNYSPQKIGEWDSYKQEAVKNYSQARDIKYPEIQLLNIKDENEYEQLVQKELEKIIQNIGNKFSKRNVFVHVMGNDQAFNYAIVKGLTKEDYHCIASVNKRTEKGEIIFSHFREYK